MKSFPMFIKTTGRRVVIAGGGEQAAQKMRLMLKTDATIVLLSEVLDGELAGIVAEGRAVHQPGPITRASFAGAAMAFIATGCPGLDAALHAIAIEAGVPTNVVDQPALCTITTPSLVDRDPVVVAIGTEGTAPVLARGIKTKVEKMLDPRLGAFAALAGRLRPSVAHSVPREGRRAFWAWAFQGAPWQAHKRGAEREAASLLKDAIARGAPPAGAEPGSIALVGAGPGARDLLTLRAVERLQEADVIFYDRLVEADVLELARRDAERVYVGKVVGASAWPQERISALIVAAARQGKRVVRLKSGDPMIFGRATEELDTARAAGIAVEVVPGVTAASAAAARLGHSLTERGASDTLVFCTGRTRDADAAPEWAAYAKPGTTLVYYMGVGEAERIAAALLGAGVSAQTEVHVATEVERPGQRVMQTTVADLARDIAVHGVTGGSVILVKLRKPAGASRALAVPALAG